jgi:hypothetical protein
VGIIVERGRHAASIGKPKKSQKKKEIKNQRPRCRTTEGPSHKHWAKQKKKGAMQKEKRKKQ